MTEKLTRRRPQSAPDGHGNIIADWSLPTSDRVIPGCQVAPASTAEDNTNRDGVLTNLSVYKRGTADILAGDAVTRAGVTYLVDGTPQQWPTGLVFQLKRWDG